MPDLAIPPPPVVVPVRAILQPSLHPRGVRPFYFAGQLDEYHAPGAVTSRTGGTYCGIDSAWLCEKVLGAPRRAPNMWPGVPGARERAIWYGQNYRTPDGKQAAPFQCEGAAFLAERDYGLLIDEMGVGKTPQAIIAAEARLSLAVVPTPTTPVVLVLCPALAKRHWQAEIKRWAGYDSEILDTLTPDPEQLCTRYVIANYDILYGGRRADAAGVVHDVEHLPGWGPTLKNRFLIAILDEAHVLRGRQSRKNKAVKDVVSKTVVVWALTGTPMPNYTRDLFGLVDVVSGGLFGFSYWAWARAYCNAYQGQYGWIDTGSSRPEELQGRLSFFVLGRTAQSVHLELPEKRREVCKVDVEVSAPTVHEGRKALATKGTMVADALRITARAKRPTVVANAVEALEAKQKVVIFVYMREQVDAIAKDIHKHVDCSMYAVHGDTSPNGRYEMSKSFREANAPACFVATIDSMGVALSLVGAHLVLFGDVVPEPWKLLQAEKRCHRFDSVVRLIVRYFIATGTIDDGIAEAVIEKIPIIEQTVGQQGDAEELTKMLGGKTDGEILDTLFAKLKSWGGGEGG